tara:strand:- start:16114 stop:18045 length:1932 start_codon:yes stop_codon:yes gene_type:complete
MSKIRFFIIIILQILSQFIIGQIRLPKLISDGVILQRDEKVKIWGWASPNELIELSFKDKVYYVKADQNGDWDIILPSQNAGGPYEMNFTASNKINIKNILFGDVWICSGQSNMELPMERVKEKYGEVIKNANNNNIRHFLVPDAYNFKKEETDFSSGNWIAATPENILNFSAVAYFFANEIYEKQHVPIGLINTALGGSPIESWLSEDALKAFPSSLAEAQKFKNDQLIKEIDASDKKRNDDWYAETNVKDEGLKSNQLWSDFFIDDNHWRSMELPGYWKNEEIGDVNGVVWFRKEVVIPKAMSGKPGKLFLGRIVDQDFVYVNGEFVGTTGYQYPPRRYDLEPTILKEGKNTIAVRVINNSGSGGFVLDKPYFLAVEKDTIDLKGTWKYKLGATMPPLQGPTFIRWKPEGLYNAMIAPLLNLKIKGVLWYQGESNTGNPKDYFKTFPALINDWRKKWHQGEFPFIFVQLANFMNDYPEPRDSNWAELRQAQLETLSVPNTGMAVTIDIGEWNDIHPLNKQDVGKRLALQARKIAYDEKNIFASSPMPNNTQFKTDSVVINFKNFGNGLVVMNGNDLKGFAISNDGKHFVWAKAKIEKNKVVVWNTKIKNPTVVRYAWDDNPSDANLFTKEGLPCTPFEVKK